MAWLPAWAGTTSQQGLELVNSGKCSGSLVELDKLFDSSEACVIASSLLLLAS